MKLLSSTLQLVTCSDYSYQNTELKFNLYTVSYLHLSLPRSVSPNAPSAPLPPNPCLSVTLCSSTVTFLRFDDKHAISSIKYFDYTCIIRTVILAKTLKQIELLLCYSLFSVTSHSVFGHCKVSLSNRNKTLLFLTLVKKQKKQVLSIKYAVAYSMHICM